MIRKIDWVFSIYFNKHCNIPNVVELMGGVDLDNNRLMVEQLVGEYLESNQN